jgi:hypothetical protein
LTQTFFLQNQGLTVTDNQYNKISEESDTAEDHVNSDDTNKFAPLNLESTHKWYVTNQFLLFKENHIKKKSLFFGFSKSTLYKSIKNDY